MTEDCFYRLASNTTTSASHSLARISLTNPKSFPAESETEPPVRHKVFPDLHLPITALITDSIQRLLRFSAARHKKASSQAQEVALPPSSPTFWFDSSTTRSWHPNTGLVTSPSFGVCPSSQPVSLPLASSVI